MKVKLTKNHRTKAEDFIKVYTVGGGIANDIILSDDKRTDTSNHLILTLQQFIQISLVLCVGGRK